ncbi:MAG: nuclear transport factor 2 family protein [Desulfobacteraceae bacterium]|jgi:hypothetical protein
MNKEIIVALEKKLESSMLSSDVEMLDKLLDDELVFTNHIGQQTTKQMDLEAHRSGFVKIESISQSNQSVNLFENVAIVTVLSEICGLFGKVRSTAKIQFTRIWQKKNSEEYKLIAAHSSLNENI